jgi:hypothetical protein
MAKNIYGKEEKNNAKANAEKKMAPFVLDARENISLDSELQSDGFDGNDIPEVRIKYSKLTTEKIIGGKYNCHIVLGRDRPGNFALNQDAQQNDPYARKTGYGGNGFRNCSSIDMVAGIGGIDPDYVDGGKSRIVKVGPNFKKDAARIYIAQTTDLDKDFDLGFTAAKGYAGTNLLPIPAINGSGIGIKADHIRIIARKEMKLVTGGDVVDSHDRKINILGGIALIGAAREEDLQPLVRGENLRLALEQMLRYLENLTGMMEDVNKIVRNLGQDLMSHSHNSPFFGAPTGPPTNGVGFKASSEALNFTLNRVAGIKQKFPKFRMNYLTPSGDGYINSRLNSTT